MKPLNNQILLSEHFDIYHGWNHLICYFEIAMPDGTYKLWEFLDHKIYLKNTWKLKYQATKNLE